MLGVWGRGIGVGCTGFSGGGGRERGRTRAPEERRVPYELMGYGEGLEGGSGAEGMDVFAGAGTDGCWTGVEGRSRRRRRRRRGARAWRKRKRRSADDARREETTAPLPARSSLCRRPSLSHFPLQTFLPDLSCSCPHFHSHFSCLGDAEHKKGYPRGAAGSPPPNGQRQDPFSVEVGTQRGSSRNPKRPTRGAYLLPSKRPRRKDSNNLSLSRGESWRGIPPA